MAERTVKKHTIAVLLENRFGAFMRVAGMFSAKGYNMDSITVGPTELEGVSRMTIVTRGEDKVLEQIIKQLNKLVDTIKVVDLTFDSFVERELVLVKVQATEGTRSEIMQIAEIFRAKVVDISPKTVTLEATGGQLKVDAIIKMLKPFVVKEIARTGRVALKREFQGEV
ncbi:MAG: acetolactate synthase small subunit [Ignavibacteria bacterium GWA2_55_11]|nr:MAG: acetolactate synthase small subunit [Ignavibacteria bacterium GWA2_55_11]OGU44264.1 MAG: acetolactate synthase small subunit [Ignavibacteria bacterium GWC2_56_12]OGU65921.1 MAG: acetolactate synthase small subunit [Ignavibacteria bacterium RIFCSPHIGHO2_02_FULL_56_12]OGU69611.1 MAG: acetolactate synthase small subunit [Ignavibacteria bacterium RIFCSPLOWO2_02_FULL_55_14]HAV22079.1 acetolactate synthase small subunit [Bacteroidota bacterium]